MVECVVNGLTLLAAAFGECLTSERMEIYVEDLKDLPIDSLTAALTRARRELKFFPKIAELRELAGATAAGLAELEAAEAWVWLETYLREYGVDGELAPSLPSRIAEVVRLMGGLEETAKALWTIPSFAGTLPPQRTRHYPFVRREFLKLHRLACLASRVKPFQLADEEASDRNRLADPEFEEAEVTR